MSTMIRTAAHHLLLALACIALLAALSVLTACKKKALSEDATDNPGITVGLLLTYDGVKVYRFIDRGRPVYFTVPATDMQWSHQESCGEKCTRTVRTYNTALVPAE